MPRYVILEHDHPVLHWDLMLEAGDHLRTWRLTAPPTLGQVVNAETSFPHRLIYLGYEGAVSGDRGTVKRWDAGVFEWQEDLLDRQAIRVEGERLHGIVRIDSEMDRLRVTYSPAISAFRGAVP